LTLLEPGWVRVDLAAGVIDSVGPGAPPDGSQVIDLGEGLVTAGFVDVHVHGGDGDQVNGDDPTSVLTAVRRIAAYHARHGTTSIVATTVSDSSEALSATIHGIAAATRETAGTARGRTGARVLGTHLEGPFIARAKLGAHNPLAARPPDLRELASLLEDGDGTIRMLTVAPELPRALDCIAMADRAGVVPAIGHTEADFETTEAAIAAGARHLTHAFNAMPPLHHRRPGPIGAALLNRDVTIELIADLEHVHPVMLELVGRLAPERLVAVSDAVPAAGLGPGTYELGRLEVVVSPDGTRVTLPDGDTLAGSVLTLDRAFVNLMEAARLPLLQALRAVNLTPARSVLGTARVGRLAAGCAADLVVLDPAAGYEVVSTLVAGQVVHDPGQLFAEWSRG
jgi:N-acetylglucosamine-6-phosphate deacetylase